MPQSPGWAMRPFSGNYSTGLAQGFNPGSLTLSLPDFRQVNDLLLLTIGHKGAGFAGVHTDWTLVARQVNGAVRGEVYMRRCTGTEATSYTVTGLAGYCVAGIVAYSGGALSGSMLDVFSVGTFAPPPPSVPPLAPPITTVTPWSLLIGFAVWEAEQPNTSLLVDGDTTARYLKRRRETYANYNGTAAGKLTYGLHDVLKHNPGTVGPLHTFTTLGGPGVGFLLAFRPETTASTPGTRYYLTAKHPPHYVEGIWPQVWDSEWDRPNISVKSNTSLLSQTKSGGGWWFDLDMTSNHTPSNLMWARWMTPPLAAQTISGTLTLLVPTMIVLNSTPGTPNVRAQLRVHAYVTVGQSTTVRGTLIAPYTSPETWDTGTGVSFAVRQITQPVTPVTSEAGDAIVVEIGIYFTALGPWPTPTRPQPSHWARIIMYQGTSDSYNASVTGVGIHDADLAFNDGYWNEFNAQSSAVVVDFSQTIVELPALTSVPPNTTWETAKLVSGEFSDGPVDTARVPIPLCPVWYKWTSDRAGRVMIHAWGTTGPVQLDTYSDPATGTQASGLYTINKTIYTSLSVYGKDVTAGEVIYIKITYWGTDMYAPEDGRQVYLSAVFKTPLAHNDVFLPASGYIVRYTKEGKLADLQPHLFRDDRPTGVAIDYSRREMLDQDDYSIHTGERLYISMFGWDGVEVVDLEDMCVGRQEVAFWWASGANADNFLHISTLAMTRGGLLYVGWFGNGFTRVADSYASYQLESATLHSADLAILDGREMQSNETDPLPETALPVALDVGGSTYIELSVDESTLFYTSGSWYIPVVTGGQTIFRIDAATGAQLAPFATLPRGPGINPGIKGLFPLPDGGCLVCNGGEVVRLDSTGATIRRYTPTPSIHAQSLADVELGDDGNFWVLDEMTTTLFKFDLVTGEQLIHLPTLLGAGTTTALVIYRRPLTPPPPPACPGDLPIDPDAPASGCAPSFPVD